MRSSVMARRLSAGVRPPVRSWRFKKIMSDGFFGNLSPFQVIVSCIAILTGAHTLYTLLAKPRLKIFLTDSVGLVVPPSEVTNKFHLGCNLVNPTAKVGVLHRLEAEVYDPQGDSRIFQ